MFGLNPLELLVIGVVALVQFVLPLAIGVTIIVLLLRSSKNRERRGDG